MKSLFLSAACLLLVPFLRGADTYVLWNEAPPRLGATFHEEMTLQLDNGSLLLGIGGAGITAAASAHTHDVVDRICTSGSEQKVKVEASTRSFLLSFGSQNNKDPHQEEGHLTGKTLTGTKTERRWSFRLADGAKPETAEATALRQFAGYTEAIEALGGLYGKEPRKIGDTWKPDLGALKDLPTQVDADLECKLEDVKMQGDEPIAQISIKGHLFAGVGDKGKLQVALNALVLRSLRDMVDLNTQINGNLQYKGAFGKAKEDGTSSTEATIEAPLKISRTVKPVVP